MKNLCCTGLAIVAGLFGFTPADASPPRAATARAERFAAAWPGTIDANAIDAATLGAGVRPDRTEPRADRVPRGADSRVVISEGFAGIERANGLFAQGWRRQNNSDHPWLVWQQGIPSSFLAADGSPSAYVASHPFATLANAGTISSWIVTPPINFASRTRVSFYTRTLAGSQWPTRMQVRVCASEPCDDVGTKPEDVGAFATLALDINPTEDAAVYPEQWTQYTLTAAEGLPAGGTGRLAFRHYVHQGDGVLRGDWTALDRVVVEQGDNESSPLELTVTVAPADPADPDACGTATSLSVAAGDQVNVCYRVTNGTNRTLAYHSLADDHVGQIFAARAIALAPGATFQHNRIVTASESTAPSATWSAQADPPGGYVVDDTQATAWIDATDGTLQTTQKIAFPADFDFRLYGDRIDELCTNWGVVTNSRDFYGSCPSIANLGVLPLPDVALSPYANALALYETPMGGAGGVYYKMLGTAPNRRFVIEYHGIPVDGGSGDPAHGLVAEAVLHEGSDIVEFQYLNVVFGGQPGCAQGGCAGIGAQNKNIAQQYSFRTRSLRTVDRIAWTPSDTTAFTRTRQVTIDVRAPRLTLDAPRIDAAAPAGGATTAVLAIGNAGDGRLDWRADTAAANSHLPRGVRTVLPLHDAGTAPFAARPAQHPTGAAAPLFSLAASRAASGLDQSLWIFDVWGGYLVSADPAQVSYETGGVTLRGTPRGRTITGADFLDDRFDTLYAIDADTHELLRYAPVSNTGTVYATETIVGTANLPTHVTPSGLKQDPTSGALYLATSDGGGSTLWTVDPATAAVTPVGEIDGAPGIIHIDFDNDGRLYGVDVALDALFAIDKTTGAASAVGSLGMSTEGALTTLAFDPSDDRILYMSTFTYLADGARNDGGFWRVDPATGQASFVNRVLGPDGGWAQFGAMTFARPGNRCVDPASVPWLALDRTTGSLAPGAPADAVTLAFDADGLADGVYAVDLCIRGNDPLRRRTAVPVTFTVGRGERLFADGFEAAP